MKYLFLFITLIFICPNTTLSQSRDVNENLELELLSLDSLLDAGNFKLVIRKCDSLLPIVVNSDINAWIKIKSQKGVALKNNEDIELALLEFEELAKYYKFSNDTNNLHLASVQNHLGEVYCDMGEMNKAITVFESGRKIRINNSAINNAEQSNCLSYLAYIYTYLEQYSKAEQCYIESIDVFESLPTPNQLDYATTLNNYAYFLDALDAYDKALPLYFKSAAIRKRELGESSRDHMTSINNIGTSYIEMGSYENAETYLLNAKNLREIHLDPYDRDLAVSYNNIAALYEEFGYYKKAEIFYRKAIEVNKKAWGEINIENAFTYQNLGRMYVGLNQLQKAEKAALNSLEILKISDKLDGSAASNTFKTLAEVHQKRNSFEEAQQYLSKCLTNRKNIFGIEHRDYALGLMNQGSLFEQQKQLEKADSCYNQAMTTFDNNYGKNNQDYIDCLKKLLTVNVKIGNIEKIADYQRDLYSSQARQTRMMFEFLSEKQKEIYLLKKATPINASILNASSNTGEHNSSNLIYDLITHYKGLLMSTSLHTMQYVFANQDSTAQQYYNDLTSINRRLNRLYSIAVNERERVSELENEKERLEKLLAKSSTKFRMEQDLNKIGHIEIKNHLKPQEASVEFTHFKVRKENDSIITMYAAALQMPKTDQTKFIPLFEEIQLQKILGNSNRRQSDLIKVLYQDSTRNKLYNLIWKPLEQHLNNVRTVYYSPSGLLHRLNLNAILTDRKKRLSDNYNLVNLSNTRVLATHDENSTQSIASAYIIGGVQYDYDSTNYAINFSDPDTTSYVISHNRSLESIERGLRGESWDSLPGSRLELAEISVLLNENAFKVTAHSNLMATEESFKKLGVNGESPRVIHLATHGFFFRDTKAERTATQGEAIWRNASDPMLRSGLLFAGANRVWGGKKPFIDRDDGILTASEISNMNLTNTELVVLSACETGLGDIKGSEGVYGLQRAFKKAGVKYLLMTLWKVPDKETSVFMTTFYKNWLDKKMSILKAFNVTQSQMRDEYKEPFKWASFVLLQ